MYEKSMGIFCPGCEPTEVEEIRAARLEKNERKAEKYDEWAGKREVKANAALNSYPSIRHDWAFITQPGHIPFRDRMNRSDERAVESLDKAAEMRGKADSLRNVRVAGDAERRRQQIREEHDRIITKGTRVNDPSGGDGVVIGVYTKSYRVKFDRGFTWKVDKAWCRPIANADTCADVPTVNANC
jgi:alkanesulfonate monooxygenase SsuD/methylene tetrahydromethanopterin reductase-like flavin-dependent oxidoreductase (luciferase family)